MVKLYHGPIKAQMSLELGLRQGEMRQPGRHLRGGAGTGAAF